MKRSMIASLALGLFVSCWSSAIAEEWFDMANCEICKPMSNNMHLMGAVKWEMHMLENGFLSISVVPEEHKEMMDAAHENMQAAIKRAEAGEEMHLCGHCKSWGSLSEAGAKKQEFDTVGGRITILTSDDKEVVEKIQAHAKKSLDEFKKMMEAAPTS